MGYTRYFNGHVTLTPELVEGVKKIIATSGVPIAGWDGTGEPVTTLEEIRFNGEGVNSCETFVITNGNNARFCKTNREPYDLVVAAVLELFKANVEDFYADSDGPNEDENVELLFAQAFS